MNGLGAGLFGSTDDFVDIQIGLLGLGWTDVDRFVGQVTVEAAAVCVGVDRNRVDPHAVAGPDNTNSYFATVGNENFIKHILPQRGIFPCLRSGP